MRSPPWLRGPAEARDHPAVSFERGASGILGEPTRKGEHPRATGMGNEGRVKPVRNRQREFQDHTAAIALPIERIAEFGQKDSLALVARCTCDIHFRFDNRHKSLVEDMVGQLELLAHDIADPPVRCDVDH